jgi:hypothetical protein
MKTLAWERRSYAARALALCPPLGTVRESEGLFTAFRHSREPPKLHKVWYLLLAPDYFYTVKRALSLENLAGLQSIAPLGLPYAYGAIDGRVQRSSTCTTSTRRRTGCLCF